MIGKRREAVFVTSWLGGLVLCLALGGWVPTAIGGAQDQEGEDQEQPAPLLPQYTENHFLSTSTLIGYAVKDEKGEEVGKIYDLLVDSQKMMTPMVVVSFGGFFGIGDDLYAIPWERIKHRHGVDGCVLSVPSAPQNVAQARPDWIALEESYSDEEPKFGQGPYGLKKGDGDLIPIIPAGTSHLVSANELIGKAIGIKGSDGEVGDLYSFVLGSGMGHLVCAVATVRVEEEAHTSRSRIPGANVGDPGLGGPVAGPQSIITYKDVAIPATLMDLDSERNILSADVSPPKVDAAPPFDRSLEEENKLDRKWLKEVYDFFGEDVNHIELDRIRNEEPLTL